MYWGSGTGGVAPVRLAAHLFVATVGLAKIEYDPAKDAANNAKHGVSLADDVAFDFEAAVIRVDDRFDCGEVRYRGFARVGGSGVCLVFTLDGETLRPISLRRAHEKEMRRYGR